MSIKKFILKRGLPVLMATSGVIAVLAGCSSSEKEQESNSLVLEEKEETILGSDAVKDNEEIVKTDNKKVEIEANLDEKNKEPQKEDVAKDYLEGLIDLDNVYEFVLEDYNSGETKTYFGVTNYLPTTSSMEQTVGDFLGNYADYNIDLSAVDKNEALYTNTLAISYDLLFSDGVYILRSTNYGTTSSTVMGDNTYQSFSIDGIIYNTQITNLDINGENFSSYFSFISANNSAYFEYSNDAGKPIFGLSFNKFLDRHESDSNYMSLGDLETLQNSLNETSNIER